MDWNDLKDKFEPLNQSVRMPSDRKEQIRQRLHAELEHIHQPPEPSSQRRNRRVVRAGSLGAALAAVICIAAVIDYTNHFGVQSGPAAGTTVTESAASAGTNASSSSGIAAGGSYSAASSNSSRNSPMQSSIIQPVGTQGVQLTADKPIEMYGNYGWMLTKSGLMHTSDGGRTWNQTHLPIQGKPYNEVISVLNGAAVRVAAGVVTNSHGVIEIFRSEDNGVTWQTTTINENLPGKGNGQVPATLTFSDSKDGWMTTSVPNFGMGGTQPGALYRTTNGAESWQRMQPSGFTNGTVPFQWITFINSTVGFTIGAPQINADAGVTNGHDQLYQTTDAGISWTKVDLALPPANRIDILQPQFTGNTGYLAVLMPQSNGTTSLNLFRSTNDGATWKQVNAFAVAKGIGNGVTMSVNAESVWLYMNGYLWVSTDNGARFTEVPNVPGAVTEVDMTDAHRGYLVIAEPQPGTAGQTHTLYHTDNGGSTWTKISQLP
ncbi:WD40/YVTN/BNR-like repeat-containing protein [Alicyclobacillus ferrooxydans]|uniref:Photosynthesis system II assembly factor Ycf48/Hcf136-like domain-containing protein n=1 Tax=Alicyclobacillus ferrooxydans TaxID=471514 RepID=A0A0P9D8G5_9BACL|nr:YCF48-related protein [Alicyclobacillus ferrooxydans]KPV45598.1 hypothetical protein AN477_01345 [Alicyclobacillus ferrooxydans]